MVCKTAQHPGLATRLIEFWGSLRCRTRNEGPSRARQHLEGTCALAIRLCNQ